MDIREDVEKVLNLNYIESSLPENRKNVLYQTKRRLPRGECLLSAAASKLTTLNFSIRTFNSSFLGKHRVPEMNEEILKALCPDF